MPEYQEQRVKEALRASGGSLQRSETAAAGRADPRLVSAAVRLLRGAGLFAMAMGFLVLVGWTLDITLLKSVSPVWVTMKPNTAFAFVLSGAALWALQAVRTSPGMNILGVVCGAVVTAIGMLTFTQDITGWDFGIDQLLFQEPASALGTGQPGRMAPITAVNFLLLGCALLLLSLSVPVPGRARLAQLFAIAVLLTSAVGLLGYAYGVPALYQLSHFSSIAIHTAVTFLALALGVLCARGSGWISLAVSRGAGGAMLRGVWLPNVVFLVLLGALAVRAEDSGFFQSDFGEALIVISAITMLTALLWRGALLLERSEVERERETEARSRLAAIVETTGDAIVSCAPDGTVLSWNAGAERILGYPAAEIIGRNITIIAPADRRHEIQHHEWLLQHGKSVPPFETIRVAKDGRLVDVQMTVSAIPDAAGGVTRIAYILRDVTERKRTDTTLQESEERFRATFEQAAMGIAHVAPDGRWLRVNRKLCDIVGYSREELLQKTFQDITHPDDLDADLDQVRRMLRREIGRYSMEKRYFRKSGEVVWINLTVSLVWKLSGEPDYFISVIENISDRKRAEAELARLAAIVEGSNDAIIGRSLDGTITSWNHAAERLLGWSAEEMIGQSVAKFLLAERHEPTALNNERLARDETLSPTETRRVTKDGRMIDVLSSVSPVRDANRKIIGVAIILRDITEQKQAQRELERKAALTRLLESLARAANEAATPEEALRSCVEHICRYGNWTLGRVATFASRQRLGAPQSSVWHCRRPEHFAEFIEVSNRYMYTGRPSGQFVSEALRERRPVWAPDLLTLKGFGRLAEAEKCGIRTGFVFPIVGGGESLAFLEFFAGEVREPDAPLLEVIGSVSAQLARVIERQHALDEARASERKLADILGTLQEVVWSLDARSGRILYLNAAAKRLTRRPLSDFLANKRTWRRMVHPDDRARLRESVRALLEQGALTHEFRIVLADGEVRVVENRARVVRDAHGAPERIDGTINDITQRLEAEENLHLAAQVIENSQEGVIVTDASNHIISVNPAFTAITGYAPQEVIGKTPAILSSGMQGKEFYQAMWASIKATGHWQGEIWDRRKNGELYCEALSVSTVKNPRGEIVYHTAIFSDISERKRAEEERGQLAAIVESSQDAIIGRSLDGTITSWNAGAERLYGYTAAEAVGRRALLLTPPELHYETERNRQLLRQGISVPPYETVRLTKDGRRFDVQLSLSPITDGNGTVIGQSSNSRDITERKHVEEVQARLAAIVENSNDAIISRSLDRKILSWNSAAERLFGWTAAEAVGQSVSLFIPPDRADESARNQALVQANRPVPAYDTVRCTKDGRYVDVSLTHSMIRNERGEAVAVSLIFRDISERKKAEAERTLLAAIVENSNDAIIGRSLDGVITSWNAGAEQLLGYSASEAIGRPIAFTMPEGQHIRIAEIGEKVQRGEAVPSHETRRQTKDGRVIDVMSSISPLRDGDGKVVGASQILHDITALKQAETAMRESEERFRAAFEQAGVGMGLRALDPRNPRWLRVNQKLCEIFGYSRDELLQLTTVDLTPPEDRGTAIDYNEKLLRGEIASYTREKRYVRKDGCIIWTNVSIAAVRAPDGRPTHVISVIEDITERKQAAERIDFLAQYDVVTGLPNRRLFGDRLTLAMARDKRLGSMTALLLLDLDRFKQINETLGHSAGDEALQLVTARLRDRLREVDTIARLGGDEFAVILESVTEKAQALRVAEKIMQAMAEPLTLKGEEVFITASIGVAVYPADADSAEKLVEGAELAMYQAKQEGRNTAQLYTPDRHPRRAAGLGMESRLRRALERDELLLHFQPKVDVRTGAITGAEALVRWRNPELGLVSPADFIPLAEETGLIVPIGEWVLHSACAQAIAWHRQGHPLTMAVNLSARQFRQNNLCEMVELALADSALDAGGLELEITESMIMHRPEQTIATLKRLHDIGLTLSVDDFGTGYSSLSYLKRFPVHKLKIDQSFVRELHKSADDTAIVRAVVALAKSLNLKTVAEGVETEQQLIFLAGLHCDEYQGYYFSKPLPAAEFLQLLLARSSAAHALRLATNAPVA